MCSDVSDWLQDAWLRLRGRRRSWKSGVFTEHSSWQTAVAVSPPYKTNLSAYGAVAQSIRRGELDIGRNRFPILAGVLLGGGKVIDFGGGLGLVYFDAIKHLGARIEWWRIVDLPDVVAYGNENLADGKLAFFSSVDEALRQDLPNVIMCSHMLQYLTDPYGTVSMLVGKNPDVLILHELPVADTERFFAQRLPPELGGRDHAVRVLSETKLAEATRGYDVLEEMELGRWCPFEGPRHVARLYRRKKDGARA